MSSTSSTKDKGKESQDKSKQVQTSRGNFHLSESDWGGFLLKFHFGPLLLCVTLECSVSSCSCRGGGRADFGDVASGALTKALISFAPL